MGRADFNAKFNGEEALSPGMIQEAGYHVVYPDGYHSWTPKDVFENAYRKVTSGEMDMFLEKESEDDSEINPPKLYCIEVDRGGIGEENMTIHHEFDEEPTREEVVNLIKGMDCGYDDRYCDVDFHRVK